MTEASPTDRKRCTATRRDGTPCGGWAIAGSAYCFAHDPERAEKRQAAHAKGGRNSAKVIRLRGLMPPRLMPVFEQLETALADTLSGDLEPRVGSAAATIARAMVAVLIAGETETRLRQLEEQVRAMEASRWQAS